ncbi:MAG: hypothetical protein IPL12_14065 [Bacteroidetes bacterium]|nr:hypothetical protein [Bacteroidota bacterium]
MKRAGYTAASAYDMDDMTYHYINGTNQLEYVDDAASVILVTLVIKPPAIMPMMPLEI